MLIWPNERKPGTGPPPGGAMAGLDSHQQAEIEAGHMKQVALLDVLASPDPDPAHSASPVQRMLEAPFNQFRPLFSHSLSDHRRPLHKSFEASGLWLLGLFRA